MLSKTAYHEAGHAVIAYRFGHRYGKLELKETESRNGCFVPIDPFKKIQDEILTLLAGHAAQKYFYPKDKSDPSLTDYQRVWKIIPWKEVEWYKESLAEADRLVKENSKQIQAVAEALSEYNILEHGVFAVIIQAVDEGAEWRKHPAWISHAEWESGIL